MVHVERMRRALRDDAGWPAMVFTPAEIADCAGRADPARHYAARFAAKEALLKGLGFRPPDLGVFRDIEVHVNRSGAQVALHGRIAAAAEALGTIRPHLSLVCTSDLAMATVIIERDANDV